MKYQSSPGNVKKVQMTFGTVDDFVNCISEFAAWGVMAFDAISKSSASSLSRSNSFMSQTELVSSPVESVLSPRVVIQDYCSFATPTRSSTVLGNEPKSHINGLQHATHSPSSSITLPTGFYYHSPNNWKDIPPNFNVNMCNSLSQQEIMLSQQSDEQNSGSQSLEFSQSYVTRSQLETPSITPQVKHMGSTTGNLTKKVEQFDSSKIEKNVKTFQNKSFNIEIRDDQNSEKILSNLESYIIRRIQDDDFKKLVCSF